MYDAVEVGQWIPPEFYRAVAKILHHIYSRLADARTMSRAHIFRNRRAATELLACEAMLADGLKEFLSELAMVNGGVMVSYICNHHHANLDDIIGSSTEHRIKPGRLIYGSEAEVDFDWGEAPSVSIAMELRDERLTAFFNVIFGGDHVGHRPQRHPFRATDVAARATICACSPRR